MFSLVGKPNHMFIYETSVVLAAREDARKSLENLASCEDAPREDVGELSPRQPTM